MKRTLFSILFSMLLTFSSFSQIQTSFFGTTLGVSDINTTFFEMYNYFKKEPFSAWGTFSVQKVNYAHYDWDVVVTSFRNKKLAAIRLGYQRYPNNHTSEDVLDRYYSLREALKDKYDGKAKYGELPDERGQKVSYYTDGRYVVYLVLKYRILKDNEIKYNYIGLLYQDEKLLSQPEDPFINDKL